MDLPAGRAGRRARRGRGRRRPRAGHAAGRLPGRPVPHAGRPAQAGLVVARPPRHPADRRPAGLAVRCARSCRRFEIRVDSAFETVVDACADPRRAHGWITREIRQAYGTLHELGWAHSVEAWADGELVGGLYGVGDRRPLRRRVDVPPCHRRLQGGPGGPRRPARRPPRHAGRRAVGDTAPLLTRRGRDLPTATTCVASPEPCNAPHPPAPGRALNRRVAVPPANPHNERMPDDGPDRGTGRDEPWLMRTYSGHSTARASNELYRTNLAKGQTGLSIAFDLPTQTGYDPDHPLARGEVGKVGVPVAHLGHMRTLLEQIPPGRMNTSMTINAPAAWLLGLYVANAAEQGVDSAELRGTTQNDIVKEYLSRGHLHLPARAVPPADRRHDRLLRRPRAPLEPHQRLLVPPAGGRGDAGPGDRLRAGRRHRRARRGAGLRPGRPRSASRRSWRPSASSATRGSASWRRSARTGPSRSCGTASASSATASPTRRPAASATACRSTRSASPRRSRRTTSSASCWRCWASRCRSGPGPARSSCRRGTRRSACPTPWDQQWSLRMQQVLAFESDLLEHGDLFDGSIVVEAAHGGAGRGGPGRARRDRGAGGRLRRHRGDEAPPGHVPHRAHAPHRVG